MLDWPNQSMQRVKQSDKFIKKPSGIKWCENNKCMYFTKKNKEKKLREKYENNGKSCWFLVLSF